MKTTPKPTSSSSDSIVVLMAFAAAFARDRVHHGPSGVAESMADQLSAMRNQGGEEIELPAVAQALAALDTRTADFPDLNLGTLICAGGELRDALFDASAAQRQLIAVEVSGGPGALQTTYGGTVARNRYKSLTEVEAAAAALLAVLVAAGLLK